MPWDTQARYNEHAAAYNEYRNLRQEYAGNFKGDTFIVNTPQDMGGYNRLQAAATRVETTGRTFEDAQKRELFGISSTVSDANQGLSSWMNLQKVTPAAERVLRVIIPKSASERLLDAQLGALGNPGGVRAPEIGQFRLGMVVGGYERFRTEPLTAAGSLTVGLAGGAVMKGATLLPKVGPLVISKGPTIGKAVDTLYGGSVALRTGMAGPDMFEMGREFGGIMTTEAIPMYGGVKAFTVASPRAAAGINRARGDYASYKIRNAPAAQVKAGYYPDGEMLLDGLKMREGMSTFTPARSLSRGRSGKSGRLVEVTTGNYVEKGRVDLFLRQFETPGQTQWRRPIPPEHLATEDILAAPAHWRTPEFGGRFGRQEPVQGWLERRIAGGPYPDGEMLLEGLKMREGMGAFTPARSLSRGRSGKSGRLVEVGPGRYVEKNLLSSHLQKYVAPPEPMPPEFIAREDILAAPAHWRTPEFGGDFSAPVKVTKMYAGIPISIGRRGLRVGGSTYSLSGRPLRVRPPRADLSIGDALTSRFAFPLASGTRKTLASGETILSRLEPTVSSRARSDTLTASGLRDSLASQMDIDTSEIVKSSLNLDSSLVPASALRSAQDQDFALLTTTRLSSRQRQRIGTRSRLREPTISVPRLPREAFAFPKVTMPPVAFGLPGTPAPKKKRKKKGKKNEFDEFLFVPDLSSSLWRF